MMPLSCQLAATRANRSRNHIGIDRDFGLIRTCMVRDHAAYERARLREGLLDKRNTAAAMWADSAYRSAANEEHLARNGFVGRIHRQKPPGRPMPLGAASQARSLSR